MADTAAKWRQYSLLRLNGNVSAIRGNYEYRSSDRRSGNPRCGRYRRPESRLGRRSDFTYIAHCSCAGRARWRVERHLHVHCGNRKHNFVDDHTMWPRMRNCRSVELVGRERTLQRAGAVGGRPLDHDSDPARRSHVRRQQPRCGNDHIFMGRGNTRRHGVQPRGPRHVWQHRSQWFPRSYFRVHVDEGRLRFAIRNRSVQD